MNKTILLGLSLTPLFGCSQKTVTTENKIPQKPNILFCIADDASWMHFSAYGCKWVSTPGFDRVAKDGILFTNAYTPNSKSAPSRACLITGRNSWQLEQAANHICNFPAKFRSFVEVLGESGYFTGFTNKGWGPGNPGAINGKTRELTGRAFNRRTLDPPTKVISRNDYAGNFSDFLDQKPNDTPWFFWYGSSEPHRQFEYGSGERLGNKKITEIDKVPGFWPDNDTIRTDMLDYGLEVEYYDQQLVKMIAELEKRGELDNTMIVVTSDNGMPFPRSKGLQYEISNHMPLAVMWLKGITSPGRISADYISFIDLAPTFLELAGISWEKSGMAPSPGESLSDILFDKEKTDRSYVLLGQERHDYGRPANQGYPIRSIIKNGFLYQYNFKPDLWPAGNPETGYLNSDGSPSKSVVLNMRRNGTDWSYWEKCYGKKPQEMLFNLGTDPECLVNIADIGEYNSTREELKKILFDDLKTQKDPRVTGNGDVFDSYEFDNPENWNFYERFMNGEIKKYQTGWVRPTDYEKEPLTR